MIDIYLLNRENMILTMQKNLKVLRQILGWSAQQLGEYMGLTRQSINNIETSKTVMSATQYVALCAVIDRTLNDKPQLVDVVSALLSENDIYAKSESGISTTFLEKWFLSFPQYKSSKDIKPSLEINENEIITIAKYYKVFVTADILEHKNAEVFLDSFTSLLKEYGNKIIVPLRVIKFMQDSLLSLKPEVYGPAKRGLDLLVRLQKEDVIDIRGESSDDTVNNLIQSVFAKHRTSWRLMLFTQSKELTEDVLALNRSKAIKGYDIVVGKLNDEGRVDVISKIDDIDISEEKHVQSEYNKENNEEIVEVLEFHYVKEEVPFKRLVDESNMIEATGWESIE